MNDIIIHDTTDNDILFPKDFARGLVPRDFKEYPIEYLAPPSEIPDMSLTEIADRIKDSERDQSNLRYIRRRALGGSHIPSLDQGQFGYCWAYSVAMTVMLKRAAMNLPYVKLSAHAVAAKIMNMANRGGWGGLSAKFIRENGIPSVEFWPERDHQTKYDNAKTWENAKLHRITEDYVDLAAGHVADQNLTKKQVLIQLVLNNPCALDFNHWGHSVCGMWAKLLDNASQSLTLDSFGIGILNSWRDSFGDLGEVVMVGSKSIPNGAVCTRSTLPSIA